jgi:DNA-binding transcriptional LysR family regulator
MDRLQAIEAFVAVADSAGFAPAARGLGLAPSTVTRLVGGLEARLGVRLLQRTTRAVRLTEPGARFLERARRILADLDEAERLAESARAAPAGRLVVAAPMMFGRLHVAPLVAAYMRRHPAVTVELGLSDRNVHLVEDGVDLAFRIGALPDASLVTRRLGATRRMAIASPGYLAEAGVPAAPQDLAGHRIVACTALGPADRMRFPGTEVVVSPAFVTNSFEAAIGLALADGGIAQVLSYQVSEAVRAGALCILLAGHEPPPAPIQAVYPSARLLSIKVRALIDLAAARGGWSFVDFDRP